MILEKRRKIVQITVVKPVFVVGILVEPGKTLSVPGDLSEVDAWGLINTGKAIDGDGSGNAAKFVKQAVDEYRASTEARQKKRIDDKPVTAAEIREMRQMLAAATTGKAGK